MHGNLGVGDAEGEHRHVPASRLQILSPVSAVASANLRRCSVNNSSEALSHVLHSVAQDGCSTGVDIVLLQECSSWLGASVLVGNSEWYNFGEKGHIAAIAAHSRLRGSVLHYGSGQRYTDLVTTSHVYVSCYMPDAGYSLAEYEETIASLNATIKQFRGRGRYRRGLVVGGDLNISAPKDFEGITGTAVARERVYRGAMQQSCSPRGRGALGLPSTMACAFGPLCW